VFAGGLKDGIEHLFNLLGSAFPSYFLNLRFDRVFLASLGRLRRAEGIWGLCFFQAVVLYPPPDASGGPYQ
jgi:hypothetical protein